MQRYALLLFFTLVAVGLVCCVSSKTQDVADYTQESLGEKLFFDPLLSSDRSVSCGSCHKREFAFADNQAFSKGVGGQLTKRNTPSVMNMFFRDSLFWDGRANDLASQVIFPVEDPHEMNLPFGQAVKRIQKNKSYQAIFKQVFQRAPDSLNITAAIIAFEKSLETDDTPNDRWLNDTEPSGFTAQMERGRDLFRSAKSGCFDCHFTPDFTNDEFKNIGLFNAKELNDKGRYEITGRAEDIGKFKVPGLRNVAVTAPYMHNGMFKTLREVIDFYDQPDKFVQGAINRDTTMLTSLNLTEDEKNDLEAFLHSLTDDQFKK